MVQFCYVLIYLFCFNVIVIVIDVVETFANSENRDSVDLLGQNVCVILFCGCRSKFMSSVCCIVASSASSLSNLISLV